MTRMLFPTYPPESRESSPSDLGLAAVDLKTAATTTSEVVDLASFTSFGISVVITVAGTTATAGAFRIEAVRMSNDGGDTDADVQLSEAITILTVSSILYTAAGSPYRVFVQWSDTLTPIIIDGASGATYTIGPNVANLRGMRKMRLRLVVTTAVNQTGAKTADVYLQAA